MHELYCYSLIGFISYKGPVSKTYQVGANFENVLELLGCHIQTFDDGQNFVHLKMPNKNKCALKIKMDL